jgi:hypothetical protein
LPNEPVRKAINDEERKEASTLTHSMWMDDPPGIKNCHFLDITKDDIGPYGISIHAEKTFNEDAQWKYLEGMLEEKLDNETATRVNIAHQRLPELFKKIKTNTKIINPFKYDCITGKYVYEELEKSLQRNISQGNGKARAAGFAIPVLGRFPKIFIDTYILKCKLQMTLRLLDIGTESSLRICIGKPCGGIRPIMVGHDDNAFLNSIAQQATQKEIARLELLPENLCSYQKSKRCGDAVIVNCIVKEVALQTNTFCLAEIDNDAEQMFD